MSTAHARLLDALTGAGCKVTNGGRASTCPAHDDRAPSLSIGPRQDGDGVVINCHAGCTAEAVTGALGMVPADLFDAPRKAGDKPVQVARYDYVDEQGTVLFEKLRFEPKTFRQKAADGSWSLQGVRRVLYRLPDVLEAIQDGRTVYLAEGEKDADALAAAGLTSTCWTEGAWQPGTAPKWREEYTEQLAGAHVVIVRDRDDAGRHTAETIAATLEPVAASVRIVEPTHGKDVSDHLAAGRSVDDLEPVDRQAGATHVAPDLEVSDEDAAERARRVFPRLDWHELWADDAEDEWLHEPLLPARRSVVIYSPPKVGKSLLMLEFAVALTRGEMFLGHQIEGRHRVLYIDFENDPRGDVRGRLQAMGYGPDDLDHLDYLSFPTMAGLDTERGSLELLEAVKAYKSEVVVIDTVSRAVDGEENSNDTWLGLYRHTGLKLKQAGVAVVRLDHTGKDESKGQRGGSAKSGDVDAVWRLSKITDERFRLECTDSRMTVATKSLHLIRQHSPRLRHVAEVLGAVTTREAKIGHIIELANSNGLSLDAGRDVIRKFAKERGITARNDVFAEVAKRRKAVPEVGDRSPDVPLSPTLGTGAGQSDEEPREMGEKSCPRGQGTVGDNHPSPHLSPRQQSLAAVEGTAGQDDGKCRTCSKSLFGKAEVIAGTCMACQNIARHEARAAR